VQVGDTKERLARDAGKLRVANGLYRCAAALSGEECELPNVLSASRLTDDELASVSVRQQDSEPTVQYHVKAVAHVAGLEEDFAARKMHPLQGARHLLDGVG
jgi:hypothetical protein